MMRNIKTSPRNEYLHQEKLRVQASPSLAERFPVLKTATVDLGCYDAEGRVCNSQIRYTVNLQHARAVFRVSCQNHECVGGDFDLSEVLARAVLMKEESVSGEIRCRGWRSRATIDQVVCGNLLRYTLTLGF